MISPLLGPSRKPLNALRGLRRKMAHFIPSAGVHRKGSSNSTTTVFCAQLKKKRRWAPGRLVAEPRAARNQQEAPDRDLQRVDHWPPIQAPTLPITAMTATSSRPR